MIKFEVNQSDVRKVLANLDKMEKAPRHLRAAVNRAATQTMRMLRKGRSNAYYIKANAFNGQIKVMRANSSHLDAVIIAADHPRSFDETNYYALKGSNFSGYSGKVKKKYVPLKGDDGQGAFAAGVPWKSKSGKSGKHYGLFIRKDKERLPIHYLLGPGVSKMVDMIYRGKRGDQGNMENRIKSRLHEELEKEIAKLM